MKFAKELEEDLVPEWRAKYLNYKAGKKKLKAISRALRNVEPPSPHTPGRRRLSQILFREGEYSHIPRPDSQHSSDSYKRLSWDGAPGPSHSTATDAEPRAPGKTLAAPSSLAERRPIRSPSRFADEPGNYGSIVAGPQENRQLAVVPSLELPDPALDPNDANVSPSHLTGRPDNGASGPQAVGATDKWKQRKLRERKSMPTILPGPRNIFNPKGDWKRSDGTKPFFRRVFSSKADRQSPSAKPAAGAIMELRAKEQEFFSFLDKELGKIEAFYLLKEDEATQRLHLLRDQLHLMRDNRLQEVTADANVTHQKKLARVLEPMDGNTDASRWKRPLKKGRPVKGRSSTGKTSSAMQQLATPSGPRPQTTSIDERRDYVPRKNANEVSYHSAKRKLKLALLEFYRGLDLLKSYADLNRKAFRKMNKKYDKVASARPTGRYMAEKVNKTWFVQSEAVENHMVTVEDLYARYFERGNRKVAVSKLRGKSSRSEDYSPNAFRNGLTLAAGLVLGIQGLVYAVQNLSSDDQTFHAQTSYLLQVYGGYFLALFHFLFFCIVCRMWGNSKINYAFVFEYDTRHVLDWRQLAELPCAFGFLQGLFIFLNFRWVNDFYTYWPILLVCITVVILFLPARIFYHRSRRWWAYSNWRLLLAGLYPVEFRDFFLGDMYCSQTYTMGNIALFFCLYGSHWSNPGQCNSSHSRAMGFMTTLPSVWRAFQCLRRFYDTRNVFPHIVNFGKYSFSILYYMTLSIYRIDNSNKVRAIFITCACINSIYTSIWDVAMDWSLGDPYAKYPFLRNSLAFRRRWVYYVAMVVDPILRFQWIFYAIFTNDVQHSAIMSFVVSLAEVIRRGIWSIFRVENEHCTNVSRFRASRDIPLPYDIPGPTKTSMEGTVPPDTSQQDEHSTMPPATTGADLEGGESTSSIRRRRQSRVSETQRPPSNRAFSRVGTLLANAHAQDFERRKRPEILGTSPEQVQRQDSSSDEEDEDDEDEEVETMEQQHPMEGGDEDYSEGDEGHVN